MTKVLNTLLFRLTKSKLLWILLAITVAMALFEVALYAALPNLLTGEELGSLEGIISLEDMFSLTVSTVSRPDTYSAMFVVIFSALFLGADFSEGTIRNAVLSNKSRWQIYAAYLIVAAGACLLFVFVQTAVYMVALALMGAFDSLSATQVVTGVFSAMGCGVVSCLVMATTTLLVLVATKKKALAIILPLAGTMLVSGVLEVVVMLGQMQGSSLGFLHWIPFAQQMFFDASAPNGALLGKILLVNGLLAVGEGALGYFVFAKAQLK